MRAVADTSAIVAAAVASSPDHEICANALRATDAAAAGHAWAESFSVLTRLPPDLRLCGRDAGAVLASVVPEICALSAEDHLAFAAWLANSAVVGGSVYDALVGWVARVTQLPLITRDRRAIPVYRELDIEVLLIGAGRAESTP